MGADSSSLQSIESLNSTLNNIENKLFEIEDIHLHHERTIAIDDTVLISGKKIKCQNNVKLLVGPVLGQVGTNSCKVLLEIDVDAEISFNVFSADERFTTSRFLYSKSIPMLKQNPTVVTLDSLSSSVNYAVYIGGIDATETLLRYLSFQSLPEDNKAIRVITQCNGRVDRIVPNEINLWRQMEKQVFYNNLEHSSLDSDFNQHIELEEDLIHNPVHLIIHCGNLISIDEVLRSHAVELLDILIREDTPFNLWSVKIDEIEQKIRNCYRNALNSQPLESMLRRCGNLFLVGAGEAAHYTSLLMSVEIPENVVKKAQQPTTVGKLPSDKRDEALKESYSSSTLKPVAEHNPLDELTPTVGGTVRRLRESMFSKLQSRSEAQEELRLLLVGILVRLIRRVSWSYFRQLWDENYSELLTTDAEQESLFRSILQLRKSIQVKVHLRSALEASGAKLLKEFGTKDRAVTNVTTRTEALTADIQALETDLRAAAVRSGELSLSSPPPVNGVVLSLGVLCVTLLEASWGLIGNDGQLLLPVVRDVELSEEVFTQLENVLAETPAVLENKLSAETSSLEISGEEEMKGKDNSVDQINLSVTQSNPPPPVGRAAQKSMIKAVICVSSCPLLPFPAPLNSDHSGEASSDNGSAYTIEAFRPLDVKAIDPSEPQLFCFTPIDVRRLLQRFAHWQQSNNEHTVLLVGAGGGMGTESVGTQQGVAIPYVVDFSDGHEISSDEEFEKPENVMLDVWIEGRSHLQQILLGPMDRHTKAHSSYFEDIALIKSYVDDEMPTEDFVTIKDKITLFKSLYDRHSRNFRRSFWDVTFRPFVGPKPALLPGDSLIKEQPAKFELNCVSDSQALAKVVVGPVVGGVGASTAVVMVEVRTDVLLDLTCVDQLTGAEYTCSQVLKGAVPGYFVFEHLQPNHAYDVICMTPWMYSVNSGKNTRSTASEGGMLWASFTTQRAGRVIAQMEGIPTDEELIRELRLQVQNETLFGQSLEESADAEVTWLSTKSDPAARKTSTAKIAGPLRLLVLGANRPSWVNLLPEDEGPVITHGHIDVLGVHRHQLQSGAYLSAAVTDVLSNGWSGVDLALHLGESIDYATTIENTISLLSLAEAQHHRSLLQARASVRVKEEEMELLEQAMDCMCNAVRYHWGAAERTQSLLAHGSHRFVCNAVLDLLSLCHATSLSMLSRDLSPYCASHLLRIMSELREVYQQRSKSAVSAGDFMLDSQTSGQRSGSVQFLDDGGVALFELSPNVSFLQEFSIKPSDENPSGQSNSLISAEQIYSLRLLLLGNESIHKPSKGKKRSRLHTLILLSPIPLVLDDQEFTDFSFLNSTQKGIRYNAEEVTTVLNILSTWMEAKPFEREVLILTAGVSKGFSTTIKVERTDLVGESSILEAGQSHVTVNSNDIQNDNRQRNSIQPSTAPSYPLNESSTAQSSFSLRMKQLCCGPLVGIIEDEMPRAHGALFSGSRKFRFQHRATGDGSNLMPQVGLVEIPTAEMKIVAMKSFEASRHQQPHASKSAAAVISGPPIRPVAKLMGADELRGFIGTANWKAVRNRGRLREDPGLNRLFSILVSLVDDNTPDEEEEEEEGDGNEDQRSARNDERGAVFNQVRQAVSIVLRQESNVLRDCHEVFKEQLTFALPSTGGVAVEQCFFHVICWVMRRFKPNSRKICKIPSSFIIRLIWQKFTREMSVREENDEKDDGAVMKKGSHELKRNKPFLDAHDSSVLLCSNFSSDFSIFNDFIQQLFESQIILDYIAYSEGFLDGGEAKS